MEAIVALLMAPWIFAGIILAWCILTAVILDRGYYFTPLLILVGLIAVHDLFPPNGRFIDWMAAHWKYLLLVIAAYLPLGCAYSMLRWWNFCRDKKDQFDLFVVGKAKLDFDTIDTYRSYNENRELSESDFLAKMKLRFRPEPADNKARLIGWIAYWPVSGAWYMTHDAIVHLFNAVYRRMTKVYTDLRDKAFQ